MGLLVWLLTYFMQWRYQKHEAEIPCDYFNEMEIIHVIILTKFISLAAPKCCQHAKNIASSQLFKMVCKNIKISLQAYFLTVCIIMVYGYLKQMICSQSKCII